jgi:hypothetical protein
LWLLEIGNLAMMVMTAVFGVHVGIGRPAKL